MHFFGVAGVPPGMGDARRSDRALTWTQRQSLSIHAEAKRSRDDLNTLFMVVMDVLGDVGAGCGEVVDSQGGVFRTPARFEDAEPVPEVSELVPDERVLDGLASAGYGVAAHPTPLFCL